MNFFRVMLGSKSVHFGDCYENEYVGVDHIDVDISSDLHEDWREFNQKYIPIYIEKRPDKTNVGAGLNCASMWLLAKGIKKDDIVLCPNGQGSYFVGEVTSDYIYVQGSKLPHQRKVKWSKSIERRSMTQKLQNSFGAGHTIVQAKEEYFSELKSLISGDSFVISEVNDKVDSILLEKPAVINPFGGRCDSSAICVTGDSGAGKSYRVEQTLIKYSHKFIFETLDPTSTGLLTQYVSGKYERNNIGEFIVSAKNDSQNFYTIVLDECHKDGFIDRINAELLQCFSTKRNNGLRFFSTNKSTDHLFSELYEKDGRRVIPDNVGFILITSKADIIENNDDIKNRVDIINLEKEDREKSFDINFLTKTKEIIVNQFENQD